MHCPIVVTSLCPSYYPLDVDGTRVSEEMVASHKKHQQNKFWKTYKTRECWFYRKYGTCGRGNMCNFAHGHAELKQHIEHRDKRNVENLQSILNLPYVKEDKVGLAETKVHKNDEFCGMWNVPPIKTINLREELSKIQEDMEADSLHLQIAEVESVTPILPVPEDGECSPVDSTISYVSTHYDWGQEPVAIGHDETINEGDLVLEDMETHNETIHWDSICKYGFIHFEVENPHKMSRCASA